MTTEEKLAEIEREFAREGCTIETRLSERNFWIPRCDKCDRQLRMLVHMKYSRPKPKEPSGGGKKAREKYQIDMMTWTISGSSIDVCADRPACRLRTAKRKYKNARRDEKARRRRERALRV